jgi:hypothetical protein
MSEVTDIVVPILQRIQVDVGDVKRDVAELKRKVDAMSDRLDKIEDYVTYSLGLISQQKVDMDRQGRAILDHAKRIETLETTP